MPGRRDRRERTSKEALCDAACELYKMATPPKVASRLLAVQHARDLASISEYKALYDLMTLRALLPSTFLSDAMRERQDPLPKLRRLATRVL